MVILQDILINEIVFELFLKNLDAGAIVTFYRSSCVYVKIITSYHNTVNSISKHRFFIITSSLIA